MVDNGKTKDDRLVAALLHARSHGTDSERVSAEIAALTERLSKAQPSKIGASKPKDDVIAAAAELLRAEFTGTDTERNRAAVEELIERLRKAQQLKTVLEACFQPATPSSAANTDIQTIGAPNAAHDTSVRGPVESSGADAGSAPRSQSAAISESYLLPIIPSIVLFGLAFAVTFPQAHSIVKYTLCEVEDAEVLTRVFSASAAFVSSLIINTSQCWYQYHAFTTVVPNPRLGFFPSCFFQNSVC